MPDIPKRKGLGRMEPLRPNPSQYHPPRFGGKKKPRKGCAKRSVSFLP